MKAIGVVGCFWIKGTVVLPSPRQYILIFSVICWIIFSDKSARICQMTWLLLICLCQIIFLSFWWKHEITKLFLWIFSASLTFVMPHLIYLSMAQLLIYVHWDARYIPYKWYQLILLHYIEWTDTLNCICA